ncbi:MAG: paraquat-inducible protein A [Campylobacterota bacterium]|nr:paraquat-inducible protein A [Campylobacterota bacterium]
MKAYQNAKSYEEISRIIVEKHNVTQLSTNQLKKLGDILSLGFYDGYDEVLREQSRLLETQLFFKQRAIRYTLYATGSAVLLLLLYFVMTLQMFTVTVSLAALIALAGGLLTPIMMMSIHKEVQYLGDVILTMESKSVLGSIAKLFEGGDYIVGGALLLFSIVLPLLKTLSMLFVALFINNKAAHSVVHFFKLLGKWSMADVFVVATFLVYLSGSKGEMSRAEVQMGIYFFLAYVILSMIASLSADKMLQENREA